MTPASTAIAGVWEDRLPREGELLAFLKSRFKELGVSFQTEERGRRKVQLHGPRLIEVLMAAMLRDVLEDDLAIFFEHQQDAEARRMAAFPGREWDAFVAHWRTKVFAEPSARVKTVESNGRVAGYVASWERDGERLVAYWFGKEHWGRGIATAAVAEFLMVHEMKRPLHAYVARANVGSIRVLEKCGFRALGPPTTGADGVEEIMFRLDSQ